MRLDFEIAATKFFVAIKARSGRHFQGFEIRKEAHEWASHFAVGLELGRFPM